MLDILSDQKILEFVSKHILIILLIYGLLKSALPKWAFLDRFAAWVSGLFPFLKKKE